MAYVCMLITWVHGEYALYVFLYFRKYTIHLEYHFFYHLLICMYTLLLKVEIQKLRGVSSDKDYKRGISWNYFIVCCWYIVQVHNNCKHYAKRKLSEGMVPRYPGLYHITVIYVHYIVVSYLYWLANINVLMLCISEAVYTKSNPVHHLILLLFGPSVHI